MKKMKKTENKPSDSQNAIMFYFLSPPGKKMHLPMFNFYSPNSFTLVI